jgi:hypothetical protein
MKRFGLIKGVCAGALAAAGAAHASITQAPALPAQVTLSWTAIDDITSEPPVPSATLEATGSASVQNGSWVANVISTEPGLIHLGDDAGLLFHLRGVKPSQETTLWKDITIDYAHQKVTGDSYFGGVKTADNTFMFAMGSFENTPDLVPQGQSQLWTSYSACHLGPPGCAEVALWSPTVFATLTVTSVPEPSSGLSMALGLLVTGWAAWRARGRSLHGGLTR